MKYIVVILDGAADYPIDILDNRTPLEVADIPSMRALAQRGIIGRVKTIPVGFPSSSDVANLSLLGYGPQQYYTGRGPLEAVNLGITLGDNDLAFRCNLVTLSEGKLRDYSAGHITDKEAAILITHLSENLGSNEVSFHIGKSYRNVMVYKNGVFLKLDTLTYYPPHDIIGKDIAKCLPGGENASRLIELMNASQTILSEHEVNKVRIDLGENPANAIWLWGCGRKPSMEPFAQKYGLKGAVISAVDLLKGIGKLIGLRVIDVEGATGYYDTNYEGKARAALEALEDDDFVFLHIEATDEAGHNQDLRMKITCLERIDKLVITTLMDNLKDVDFRILITPDHPTPIAKRTHTNEPVPFLIYGQGVEKGNFSGYSELEAQNSTLFFDDGPSLLRYFLK